MIVLKALREIKAKLWPGSQLEFPKDSELIPISTLPAVFVHLRLPYHIGNVVRVNKIS